MGRWSPRDWSRCQRCKVRSLKEIAPQARSWRAPPSMAWRRASLGAFQGRINTSTFLPVGANKIDNILLNEICVAGILLSAFQLFLCTMIDSMGLSLGKKIETKKCESERVSAWADKFIASYAFVSVAGRGHTAGCFIPS